jgi:hypothetical protein
MYASLVPSGLVRLSRTDCCGVTDSSSNVQCVATSPARAGGAIKSCLDMTNPNLNRRATFFSSLFSLFLISLLSQHRGDPAPPLPLPPPVGFLRSPFASKLSHPPPQRYPPFESCRFSFYYLYCFV